MSRSPAIAGAATAVTTGAPRGALPARVTASALVLAALTVITSCSSASEAESSSAPSSSPSATTSAGASSSQSAGPGSSVEGFLGVEDFPIKLVPPEGFRAAPSEGGGTRIYVIEGTSGSGGALLVSSIAGIEADQLPADIAALIRRTHKDVVVRNVGATEVDGRPAQAFTLDQKPGTAPRDLSCARTGTCFKLLGTKPMDMTVVRHPQGVVLFAVEYLPEDRATVRRSMQDFLASVRWE